MTSEEARQAGMERARKMQRIINAYHRVFATEEGKAILEDLKTAFGYKFSTFLNTATTPGAIQMCPYYGAVRSGQRDVILHIEAKLEAPVQGDGNIVKPLAEVLTGMRE